VVEDNEINRRVIETYLEAMGHRSEIVATGAAAVRAAAEGHFDAVLMVIGEGDTRRGDLERSLELLGDKPILGTVLNRSEEPTTGYSYY
jgi:two-component system sensor histidine kinase TorS